MESFQDTHYADLRDPKSWKEMLGAAICVLCAALAAGLTVGLMSLDPLELEVKRRVGTPDERRHAEKVGERLFREAHGLRRLGGLATPFIHFIHRTHRIHPPPIHRSARSSPGTTASW